MQDIGEEKGGQQNKSSSFRVYFAKVYYVVYGIQCHLLFGVMQFYNFWVEISFSY